MSASHFHAYNGPGCPSRGAASKGGTLSTSLSSNCDFAWLCIYTVIWGEISCEQSFRS